MSRERAPPDPLVLGEQIAAGATPLFEQPSRPFDVREQESDRAAVQLSREPPCRTGCSSGERVSRCRTRKAQTPGTTLPAADAHLRTNHELRPQRAPNHCCTKRADSTPLTHAARTDARTGSSPPSRSLRSSLQLVSVCDVARCDTLLFMAVYLDGLLIPRSKVRILHGPCDLQGNRSEARQPCSRDRVRACLERTCSSQHASVSCSSLRFAGGDS
jgi:hypothetical protein